MNIPTQALLDSFSIRERLGQVKGKKVVIIGDVLHSRVALSNIHCLQKLGAEVAVCGPSTLIPKIYQFIRCSSLFRFKRGFKLV